MGSVWAMVVVEGDPSPDAGLGLRPRFPSVQENAFILQGPPEARHVEGIPAIGPKECPRVVAAAPLAIQRDPGADPFQSVGPGKGRELAVLICVHDLCRAGLVDRLVRRLDAEVGLKRGRYPLGQHLPGMPVHDGDQIEEAFAHRQVGDVGLLEDRHQAH
jgi:hypothetical protein